MSMEAMKTLAEAEAAAAARVKANQEAGETQLAEAARSAAAQRADQRTAADADAKMMMTDAEERAAIAAQTTLAQASTVCETMEKQAEGRLAKAAALIAERVVNI